MSTTRASGASTGPGETVRMRSPSTSRFMPVGQSALWPSKMRALVKRILVIVGWMMLQVAADAAVDPARPSGLDFARHRSAGLVERPGRGREEQRAEHHRVAQRFVAERGRQRVGDD